MLLASEEKRALLEGYHADPHSVLGMHETEDGLIIRALNPSAQRITVLAVNADVGLEMEKTDEGGLFELEIKDVPRFRYQLETENFDGVSWTSYDAYSFEPEISDKDIWLFGHGTHYQIYEKLGANARTIDGVDGFLFGVWAPHARRVSVVGDFNGWDGKRHAMRNLYESGVWEIFIPGLCSGDCYKFEILTQSGKIIYKADPYGKYAEMRPATASRVFDLSAYGWHDEAWMKGESALVSEGAKKEALCFGRFADKVSGPMNIYEVHIGSWMRDEYGNFLSYTEIADKLVPYVKEMGFTHIELLPVQEHPLDESWGYQITGYYAATSRFGSPEGLMYLIDKCHQNDIGVILDWVPAHFPKDEHGLYRFDGDPLYEYPDPRKGERAEWGTMVFNYEKNEVINFLIANAIYWIKEFHADGLRVDAVASMLYLDYAKRDGEWVANKYGGNTNLEAIEFLKHLNSIVPKYCPGAIMIAEESTAWAGVTAIPEEGGLGFSFKWNMGWMHDFLGYMHEEEEHRKYHHNEMTFASTYIHSEKYILVLSHDEVVHTKSAMIGKMPGDEWRRFANLRAAYGFMYTHPGKKLLFMGGELGQYSEWNEGKELEWGLLQYDIHAGLQRFVKDLGHVYKEQNALWCLDDDGFGFEWINADDAEHSTYSFIRRGKTKEDTLVVLCNFTSRTYEDFKIGMPFEGFWKEILNSDAEKYGGSGVTNSGEIFETAEDKCDGRKMSIRLRLAPLSVTILKNVKG